MTKKLSKEAEKRILAAVNDVVARIQSDNELPTEAVVKVAREYQLNPHMVRLVCTGYNRGASNFQREQHEDVLDKMAEFPLADAAEAIEQIWPSQVASPGEVKLASVISDEYARPVARTGIFERARTLYQREKAAQLSPPPVSPPATPTRRPDVNHVYRQVLGLRKQAERARTPYIHAQEQLLAQLGNTADYFKSARQELPLVALAARCEFGKAGQAVVNFICHRNGWAEERGHTAKQARAIDWQAEPFARVKACVQAAERLVAEREKFAEVVRHTARRELELGRPFGAEIPLDRGVFASRDLPKTANITPWAGGAIGGWALKNLLPTKENLANKAVRMTESLDDPVHESNINQLRTQSVLFDLLNNDPVISGHDPQSALAAYNELAQLSPRSAMQPSLARAWIRKSLAQGSPETFEGKEMADIEKSLTETAVPDHQGTISHINPLGPGGSYAQQR